MLLTIVRVHSKCEIRFYICTVLCVLWAMHCCVVKLVTHCHRPVKNRVLKLDCWPPLNYMHVTKTFLTFGRNYYTEYIWRSVLGFDFLLILASKFVWMLVFFVCSNVYLALTSRVLDNTSSNWYQARRLKSLLLLFVYDVFNTALATKIIRNVAESWVPT